MRSAARVAPDLDARESDPSSADRRRQWRSSARSGRPPPSPPQLPSRVTVRSVGLLQFDAGAAYRRASEPISAAQAGMWWWWRRLPARSGRDVAGGGGVREQSEGL